MENIQHSFFRVKYAEVLPAQYPCPDCGQLAKRNSTGERTLQEPNLDEPTFLLVRMSVCRCDNAQCGRKYFRVSVPFAPPRVRYTEDAKQLCVSSVVRDGMPFCRVPDRVAEDFHLYPSQSTVWGWHRDACDRQDLTVDYEPWVKAQFSGVLCIDEVYDGPFCLILSTDPLNDVTVAYTLEKKTPGTERPKMSQAWLDRHLWALARIGIEPTAVIRDGLVVYDNGLPQTWDQSRCTFHLLQDITQDLLRAVNTYRKTLPDPPKRSKGRPKADAPPPPPNVKTEIWHHRYLWVSHPETIEQRDRTCTHQTHRCVGESDAEILQHLCAQHPPLQTIRACMLEVFGLFEDPDATFEDIKTQYDTMCQTPAYQANPDLVKALDHLSGDTLEKAFRFLAYENLPKTNNHVEGRARSFRKRQKSHYRLRRSSSIDRAMKAEMLRQKARKQARGDPVVRLRRKGEAAEPIPLAEVA